MPCLLLAVVLAGCATRPLGVLSPADVPAALSEMPTHQLLLLGEQHDADAHQALERATVAHLAQSGRLTTLVLEMAERGAHTRGLAADATEADVRSRHPRRSAQSLLQAVQGQWQRSRRRRSLIVSDRGEALPVRR